MEFETHGVLPVRRALTKDTIEEKKKKSQNISAPAALMLVTSKPPNILEVILNHWSSPLKLTVEIDLLESAATYHTLNIPTATQM